MKTTTMNEAATKIIFLCFSALLAWTIQFTTWLFTPAVAHCFYIMKIDVYNSVHIISAVIQKLSQMATIGAFGLAVYKFIYPERSLRELLQRVKKFVYFRRNKTKNKKK